MAARTGRNPGPAATSATETGVQPVPAPVEPGDPDEALAGILSPRDVSRTAYVQGVLESHGVDAELVDLDALLPDLIAVLVMADPEGTAQAVEQAQAGNLDSGAALHTETVVAVLHADNVWVAIAHASATGRCNCRYLLRRLAPLFGRTMDESYEPAAAEG